MLLEAPNAVQLKYSCRVSNGNKNGQEWFSSSHQAGRLELESTNGSWICWRSLLVIFLLLNCSGVSSWSKYIGVVLRSCSRDVVITNKWRRSWRTSSTVQFDTDGVPAIGVDGERVVPATELLPLLENNVTIGVDRPSSFS